MSAFQILLNIKNTNIEKPSYTIFTYFYNKQTENNVKRICNPPRHARRKNAKKAKS